METKDLDIRQGVSNLVPTVVAQRISEIPSEYWELTEEELEELAPGKTFSAVVRKLRFSFWQEHATAVKNMDTMNISHVYAGVCSRNHFYSRVITDDARLAYLLLPPSDYAVATKEVLDLGLKKLRQVFDMPLYEIVDGKKVWLPKNADVMFKIWKALDERVNGAVIQKTQNLNLNAEVKAPQTQTPDMDEIDKKLKALQDEFGLVEDAQIIESEQGMKPV